MSSKGIRTPQLVAKDDSCSWLRARGASRVTGVYAQVGVGAAQAPRERRRAAPEGARAAENFGL